MVAPVFAQAADAKALVFYSFVKDRMREAAKESAEHFGVFAVDVIGGPMQIVGQWLQMEPSHKPGRVLDKQYFTRIEALAFAQKHDDGQRPEDLPLADVVLLGLSRSGKTPLMHMLADHGLRAANIPLVTEVPPPEQLSLVEPNRVFLLRIQPERLRSIRMQRLKKLGLDESSPYVNPRLIQEEVRMIERLHADHPEWRTVDMTRRAVEEAAGEIIQLLGPIEV
jgi:regulator of PEP synthase PpsR (kinase-PPPase family)